MSKKSKTTSSKAPKAKAGKKPGKKPTVAEAVAERKAEEAAAVESAVVTTPTPEEVSSMVPAAKAKKAKAPKVDKTKKSRMRDDGTYSVLDAAHKVLKEASTPLDAQTICERALADGYWKTKGKTPQATIYAAMIREIAAKGDQSRFKKVDRGQFTAAN